MSFRVMTLEERAAAALAISTSELRFTICLFACLPVGWCQRQIRSVMGAHLFAILSGALLIYLPFGSGVLHLLPPILFTFAATHLSPKHCGTLAWLFCFPYLIYKHVVNASGAAWREGAMDATGALMIIFLKMVAIAECRQAAAKSTGSKNGITEYQKQKMIHDSPSLLEFMSYALCFGHLLCGPFTEFKDYKNYIERRDLWSGALPSRGMAAFRVFVMAIIYVAIHVQMNTHYSFSLFLTEAFKSSTLAKKYLAVLLVGASYRLKYYFAWGVAEAASIASGFGYNGTSDKENGEKRPKWDRCKNVDILPVEFATSVTTLARDWNICTGTFLRRYVYDKLTGKGGKSSFRAILITQLVSAVWHGLYPGYFIFFASTAVSISSSKVLHRWEQHNEKVAKAWWYKFIKLVYTSVSLNYAATSFLILSFRECIQVYASLKFIPHVLSFAICWLGPFLLKGSKRQD